MSISDERLAGMLADIPTNPDGTPWTIGLGAKVDTNELHSILTEFQSLRAAAKVRTSAAGAVKADPVAWQKHHLVADIDGSHWSEWETCTRAEFDAISQTNIDWEGIHAEARPLYSTLTTRDVTEQVTITDEMVEAMARVVFPNAWRPRPDDAGKFFETNLASEQAKAKGQMRDALAALTGVK